MAGRSAIGWVETNVATMAQAKRLARAILAERLAACANMNSIDSAYWWKGRLERAREIRVVFKTAPARVDALVARLNALHPYDVPYVAWGRGERVLPRYAAWAARETASRRGGASRARRRTGRAGCRATR